MPSSKKAKITDENRQESAKLKLLWDASKDRASQAVFAEKYDLGSQGNVGHYLSGRNALNPKSAAAFAKELKCAVEDFSPRVAAELSKLGNHPIPEGADPLHGAGVPPELLVAAHIKALSDVLGSLDEGERRRAGMLLNDLALNPKDHAAIAAHIQVAVDRFKSRAPSGNVAEVDPQYQEEINNMTKAAEARRELEKQQHRSVSRR